MTPTESLSLVSHMQALGVHLAFDAEQADFTSIATFPDPSHRPYISNAFHRAFIRVDELGTEAAAATAVVMAEGAGMPTPAPSVMFNRPFFFQLIDVPSGATLFLGRVTNPLNH
jgi:serpin B